MQFIPESSGISFFANLVLLVLAPILYATARYRLSDRISRLKSYMGAIVAGDIIALLLFIFQVSILPEASDKAYMLVLVLALGSVAGVMTGDLIFRIRRKGKPSARRKKSNSNWHIAKSNYGE